MPLFDDLIFRGNDDYDPSSYTPFDSSSLFGDVGSSSLDDYDPSSYTPFDSSIDWFGGDDDVLGGYDPSSYTPFDSSFDYDYDFGSGSSSLDDYDPSSYTPGDLSIDWDDIYSSLFGGEDDILGGYDPSSYTPFDSSIDWDDKINSLFGGEDDILGGYDPVDLDIDFSNIPDRWGDEGEKGPLGGGWWPAIRNTLIGSGGGPLGGNILGGGEGGAGILGAILGLGGQGGGGLLGLGGGEAGEGGLGSFLSGANPLMQFLMMKSLMGDDKSGSAAIPIGGEAYGGPAFNYQDYQPTNLTPALMPGVGYANMGPPPPPPPPDVRIPEVPGMMHGGDVRPGDITFAKLEPGEFVIQKPAVDAVGIETLEQINNMGNGGAYYG